MLKAPMEISRATHSWHFCTNLGQVPVLEQHSLLTRQYNCEPVRSPSGKLFAPSIVVAISSYRTGSYLTEIVSIDEPASGISLAYVSGKSGGRVHTMRRTILFAIIAIFTVLGLTVPASYAQGKPSNPL